MSAWQDQVRALPRFEPQKYDGLDLDRLVVYTIAELQELQIPMTFESVVAAAYVHFPERFALVGFPEYPDAARVGRVLLHLRPKYRDWATGTVARGFVLTETGKRVLAETREHLKSAVGTEMGKPSRSTRKAVSDQKRTRDVSDDLRDVLGSPMFRQFTRDGSVPPKEAGLVYALLGGFPYTPKRALLSRLEALRGTATALGRSDVELFLGEVKSAYASVFHG